MKTNNTLLWIVVFCFVFERTKAGPKLIVVLVDGVRWDYLDDPKLKGLRKIADTGVRAPYVAPIFPSLSYPNWYTIVTGLYPENHGFVDNHMYDNETDSFYRMKPDPNATDPIWWNEAEPIWITAEKNKMSTAMYWWGGCETRIRGYHPMICERERFGPPTPEEREDFLERIDDIVEMFKPSKRFPKDRLSLALMYYGATDYEGHKFGPNTKEAKEALYDIDTILDSMLNKLQKTGLRDKVNVMVVSDHGMTDVSNLKPIDLERFRSLIKYQVSVGTQSLIVPHDNKLDELYQEMKQANMDGVEVYKKEDIPEKYHIKGSKRMTPILLVARKGFVISRLKDPTKEEGKNHSKYMGGHGYDAVEDTDMRAIFLATGPDFQENQWTEALNMTDLYNVMCKVLHLNPLPNNGSWDKVKTMLKTGQTSPSSKLVRSSSPAPAHAHLFCIILLVMVCLFVGIDIKCCDDDDTTPNGVRIKKVWQQR